MKGYLYTLLTLCLSRRFPKRIYVQPPDVATCSVLLKKLLKKQGSLLTEKEIDHLARFVLKLQ